MKKLLALSIALCMAFGYGSAQDLSTSSPQDIIDTMMTTVDDTLDQFLSDLGNHAQQIVEDNTALYLSDYCTANDVMASVDIVDCGKYQGIVHVLDNVLDNIVPDISATMDVSSDDIASIDEAQVIIEEAQAQVKQEITKFDALSQVMQKALNKPNLTDKQIFGIKYVLFAIACVKDIFGLLPAFLQDMMQYVVDLRNTFGDVSIN